ncbi:MAG: ATP-binding protein, partial [Deltaproteobacteria bacterium]
MYFHRNLEKTILNLSEQFPVILVTGPRQVGKTTVLQHLAEKGRRYVTLDTWEHRQLANSDPKLFLEQFPPPVIIDEIQYAPALFTQIKIYVDQKKENSSFWLSGSQQFSLMKNLSESLSGRVAILKLLGFSSGEIAKKEFKRKKPWSPLNHTIPKLTSPKLEDLSSKIFHGGFPKLYSKGARVREDVYFSSYVQTYLERDVRDLTHVGDLRDFERFVRACAARTAQILNITELARDIGIAPNTAKKWLSILEASFQVYLLEPYYKNITKRMIKSPKLYFLDTGLLAYLTGWKSPET